jgi:hypothetical protein
MAITGRKRDGLPKGSYLIGVVLAVVGAMAFSGTASASVTGQTYTVRTSPPKQDKKVFGAVGPFFTAVDTSYSGGFSPVADQTVLTYPRDLKFVPGNLPECPLNLINNKPVATARAACPGSIVGQGSAIINGGALTGVVTAFGGLRSPPTIYLHTSINNDALDPVLTGVLNMTTNTLTVSIPNTGTAITHFDTTINRVKTGKKTFFIMARCSKKKWVNSETTHFLNGTSITASSTQTCKQKRSKKKK